MGGLYAPTTERDPLPAQIISDEQAMLLREARDASNEAIRGMGLPWEDCRHHAAAVAA